VEWADTPEVLVALNGYYIAFMVDSGQGVAGILIEFVAGACVVILGVFVWRGSLIAVIVSTIVCVLEVIFAAPAVFLFALWGPSAFLYLLAVPAPLLAPGVLAVPTLILCVTVLAAGKAVQPIRAIPPAGPPGTY